MIYADDHGNRYVVMADGARVPLEPAKIVVRLETAIDNQIIGAADAIALHATSARHWYEKYQEAQTIIADLREQLAAKG